MFSFGNFTFFSRWARTGLKEIETFKGPEKWSHYGCRWYWLSWDFSLQVKKNLMKWIFLNFLLYCSSKKCFYFLNNLNLIMNLHKKCLRVEYMIFYSILILKNSCEMQFFKVFKRLSQHMKLTILTCFI